MLNIIFKAIKWDKQVFK